jgi:hypothetical protein
MRKLPIAVALSAAVHGAAIAWVQTRPRPKPEAPRTVTTVEIVEPAPPKPDEEPVAVALLDDHSVPAISGTAAGVSHATSGTHRGHGAISTGAGHGETPAGPTGQPHSPLMGMRGQGHQLAWTPSAAFDAALAANDKPIDVPPPPSGELKPSGNGTYTTDHGIDGAFVGTVHRDGTVSIKDKPTVGDIHFAGLGLTGRANFDDWAMHEAGIDPYASAKRQWLDKTREERVRIGAAYRKEQLARTPEYMKRNLAWAWSRTANDPAARKQALFELWDDCAETGDDSLVAAGTAARLYVVGFIRAHLPQGTAGAFTSEDLSRLNSQKRSSTTFQPY